MSMTNEAARIHGDRGYTAEFDEGTTEIQKTIIARDLLAEQ